MDGETPTAAQESVDLFMEDDTSQSQSVDQDLKKLRALHRYYSDGLALCTLISRTMPTILYLLQSSKKTDILESINFIAACRMFGMTCAEPGMRLMVHRVWEKEVGSIKEIARVDQDGGMTMNAESVVIGTSIRDAVAGCYKDMYLVQYPPGSEKEDAIVAANNLIKYDFEFT